MPPSPPPPPSFTSPSPGCRVRGWRARHSLQVRRRRHSSGEWGIGEQAGPPQPSLGGHEVWLITFSQAPPFLLTLASSWCLVDTVLQAPHMHPKLLSAQVSQSCSSPPHLVMVPRPPITQARDTGRYPMSSWPSSHRGLCLLNSSLTIPSSSTPAAPPPVQASPFQASTCSLPSPPPPSQACPCPLLLKPSGAPHHPQWRAIIPYSKSLKAHLFQNFPGFRKAVGAPAVT